MKKTGADILVECLKKEGVEHLFGYPGGVVLPVFDSLFDASINVILVRHEQGAVHAADGFARATGRPGVCLVTSGPGATNTVTGIATAYMDGVPLVVITGQVPSAMIGNDAFQEADIVGITRPCTKHSYLVKETGDIARTIREAFFIAATGKPGPVLIDLPKDIATNSAKFSYPEKVHLRGYNPTFAGNTRQVQKAVHLISESKCPVIFVGGGIITANASAELRIFAETTSIPVTSTLMGLGGFHSDHDLYLGMCGMHGTYQANMALTHSDLIVCIGARFDDRVTGNVDKFAPNARIVHIDIDPASIGKNIEVDVPIVGDAKDILRKLNSRLKKAETKWRDRFREWRKKADLWKEENPLGYSQGKSTIKPQYVIEQIFKATGGEAIIATEVGQNQMWTAQFYRFHQPRTFLTSGGLGTMGYGFPAAIGAQIAFPDKTVFNIAGDGSIQMNIQELATAVQYKLPVKVAILNNGFLGMVRQWQQLFFNRRYSSSSMEAQPDFVKLAEAFGAKGLRAEKVDEVRGVIDESLETRGPVLIDFKVAREENVYPMVPAGAGINEMLLA